MIRACRLFIYALLIFFYSCTPQKKLIYFEKGMSGPAAADPGVSTDLKIYPEDILSVQLFTINPDAMPGISTSIDKQVIDNRSSYEKGFIVDRNGFLDLPLVGKIPVAGLTLLDARDTIVHRFSAFVDDPVVVLKKLSFKCTILGEVNKPGMYYIPNEKMTIIEALGMAGDLNNYADRTEIKIFRKLENNEVKELKFDLTKTDILLPQNRYVQQDDIIYVKPIRRKALANINPALVVITSMISTTAIVISLIIRINEK